MQRPVLLFRRLEAGDVRHVDGLPMPESPYVEARAFTLATAPRILDELRELESAEVAFANSNTSRWPIRFEPIGVSIAAFSGIALCAWLGFLPQTWSAPCLLVALFSGVMLVLARRQVNLRAAEQAARWLASEPGKQSALLQDELRMRWVRMANLVRELGFAVELRVAEGGNERASLQTLPIALGSRDRSFHAHDLDARSEYEYVLTQGGVQENRTLPSTASTPGIST